MTTKKLSELEVLEALGEETYAVVEENGEAKRYPAGGFGAVKSVNGVTPDEAGNVAVEIPEGFSGSWNDLTDKPFGEVGQELYNGIPPWDGTFASISGVPLRLGVKYSFYLRLEDGTEKKMNVTAVEGNYENNIACTYTDGEYDFEFYYHPMYKDNTLYIRGSKWLENASTYNLRICFRYVQDAYLEMDSKYLPKVASISDVSDVPTADEFNALLAALRAAGYMNS